MGNFVSNECQKTLLSTSHPVSVLLARPKLDDLNAGVRLCGWLISQVQIGIVRVQQCNAIQIGLRGLEIASGIRARIGFTGIARSRSSSTSNVTLPNGASAIFIARSAADDRQSRARHRNSGNDDNLHIAMAAHCEGVA